jgi:hypothetical protein
MVSIATHVTNKIIGYLTAVINKGNYHDIIMQKNNVSINLPIELQHIIFRAVRI